jgi:hypothetical protein
MKENVEEANSLERAPFHPSVVARGRDTIQLPIDGRDHQVLQFFLQLGRGRALMDGIPTRRLPRKSDINNSVNSEFGPRGLAGIELTEV